MSRNNKLISENLRTEIAKELGVYDQVKKDGGWENVSSKTCGNIVSKAIEIAKSMLTENIDINIISKCTGLAISEINSLN